MAGRPRTARCIPLGISTGIPLLHARTHPGDGSIWLAGFRIYDSGAPDLQGIGRLRPAREPLSAPVDARVVAEGVVIRFDAELDPASVMPDAVLAKEWQYRRSSGYGSPRLKRDGNQGADSIATGGTFLSKDGKSVFIHIPELKPTMQLEIIHRSSGKAASLIRSRCSSPSRHPHPPSGRSWASNRRNSMPPSPRSTVRPRPMPSPP